LQDAGLYDLDGGTLLVSHQEKPIIYSGRPRNQPL
jgi:hypothetical protein